MSGRPDPAAARWGAAGDAPADGDPPDPDTASGAGVAAGAATEAGNGPEPGGARSGAGPAEEADAAGTILSDVAALTAERDDYLQSLQRLKADFDNYRKRVARLQEEQAARAAAALVQKVLPVLDNLDLAVDHLVGAEPATEDARALIQARAQLLDVLTKEGLERVDATEVPFDPTVHDAVSHAPAAQAASSPADAAGSGADPAGGTGPARPADQVAAHAEGPGAGDNGNGAKASSPDVPAAAGGAPAGAHEEVVDGVMRAGYRWRGQVLRPAMVRVRG